MQHLVKMEDFWLLDYTHPGPDANRLLINTPLRAGKGYWFISKNPITIIVPSGNPAVLNYNQEFVMRLTEGWNLIGNPYLVSLNWPSILTYNVDQGYVNASVILTTSGWHQHSNGGYNLNSNIDAFEGGWIETTSAATIYLLSPTSSGRLEVVANQPKHESYFNTNDDWQLIINLADGEQTSNLAGIGMHPESLIGFDLRDVRMPPKISQELKFELLEQGTNLTKNIVPPRTNYDWTFLYQCFQ